jgi:hypothetical protein
VEFVFQVGKLGRGKPIGTRCKTEHGQDEAKTEKANQYYDYGPDLLRYLLKRKHFPLRVNKAQNQKLA